MKTDELVEALSTHVEPVDRRLIGRNVGLALVAAIALTLGLAVVGLGVRADAMTARAAMFLVAKVAFAIAIVCIALVYLLRLARPGGERRTSSFWTLVPFAAVILLAVISLGSAPRSHWDRMILGRNGWNASYRYRS